jgi:transcriptional regulator with XRE-family HTH domain
VKQVLDRIEVIRSRRGITKSHIARYCNKTPSWYTGIITGRRNLLLEDAYLIAEAMEVEINDLVGSQVSETRNSSNTA